MLGLGPLLRGQGWREFGRGGGKALVSSDHSRFFATIRHISPLPQQSVGFAIKLCSNLAFFGWDRLLDSWTRASGLVCDSFYTKDVRKLEASPNFSKNLLPTSSSSLPPPQSPWDHGRVSPLGPSQAAPVVPAEANLNQLTAGWPQPAADGRRLSEPSWDPEPPSCPIELRTIINVISSHWVWG